MERHAITHLLTKNAGGGRAKLEAARALGLQTLVISRPPQPPGPIVETPERAVAWIAEQVAAGTGCN